MNNWTLIDYLMGKNGVVTNHASMLGHIDRQIEIMQEKTKTYNSLRRTGSPAPVYNPPMPLSFDRPRRVAKRTEDDEDQFAFFASAAIGLVVGIIALMFL